MRIYTRSGDGGETDVLGGGRVRKDDVRVEAVGALDELNAAVGWCRTLDLPEGCDALLAAAQRDLFHAGADIAAPEGERAGGLARMGADAAERVERAIDRISERLPPLRHFILPGGTRAAAAVHVARAAARAAERRCVALAAASCCNPHVIVYLNRLSDFLFVVARLCNADAGRAEEQWTPNA